MYKILLILFLSTSCFAQSKINYVFDVKNYGAKGDGVTDDGAAIGKAIAACKSEGGGTVYFPIGNYVTNQQYVLDFNVNIKGEGMGAFQIFAANLTNYKYSSAIYYTSPTGNLFTFQKDAINNDYPIRSIQSITLINKASTTPTAGSAVKCLDNAQNFVIRDVLVTGFYINFDYVSTTYWLMDNVRINAPIAYGIRLGNNIDSDLGDWSINNCIFSSSKFPSSATAFYWKAGGGGKITNTKFNSVGYIVANNFIYDILADMSDGPTSLLQVSNCSFENFQTAAVKMTTSGNYVSFVQFNNCEFAAVSSASQTVIDIDGFRNVSIDNIVARSYAGNIPYTFMKFNNIEGLKIGYGQIYDYQSYYTITNSTEVNVSELQLAGITRTYNPVLNFDLGFKMYHTQTGNIAFSLGTINRDGTQGMVRIVGNATGTCAFLAGWINKGAKIFDNTKTNFIYFTYDSGNVVYEIVN